MRAAASLRLHEWPPRNFPEVPPRFNRVERSEITTAHPRHNGLNKRPEASSGSRA